MRVQLCVLALLSCATTTFTSRPQEPSAAITLLELPAYTAWCSPLVVDAGELAEGQLTEVWGKFMRALDGHLVGNGMVASGYPYIARTEVTRRENGAPDRVTHEACVTVPATAALRPGGKDAASLAARTVPALEKVVVRVCADRSASNCLDDLRAELRAALPDVARERIEAWPWRLFPYDGTDANAVALRDAVVATGTRLVATPVASEGTIVPDAPELGMDGKPVLRPLRTAPTGKVRPIVREIPRSSLAVVTVPPEAADTIKKGAS